MAGQISGTYVAVTAVGAVLVWSGWKGTTLAATFKSLLAGNLNAPATETAAASSASPASVSGAAPAVSGAYSATELEALWTSQGGDASTAFEAAQVALAESSGDPDVTSSNPVGGGTNVGLWQLETPGGAGNGYTVAELQNPETNCQVTIMQSNNGSNWSQWADRVVVNGKYVGPAS